MSQDMTTLLATITALQSRLEALETKPKSKKAVVRHGRPAKPYAGLSGCYFMLNIDLSNENHVTIQDQVQNLLADPEYLASITKITLGRAILNHATTKGGLIFWASSQDRLMFGPARHGAKTASPAEFFNIPITELIQLGDGTTKNSVEVLNQTVSLDEFVYQEKQNKQLEKIQQKLNALGNGNNIPKKK